MTHSSHEETAGLKPAPNVLQQRWLLLERQMNEREKARYCAKTPVWKPHRCHIPTNEGRPGYQFAGARDLHG